MEHLDAIALTIPHIEEVVVGQFGAMHWIAELLRGRLAGIVLAGVLIIGLVPISAPMALIFSGVRVEYDHAMVAVTVGDVDFIRLGVDKSFGRQSEVRDIVRALASPRL